MTDSALLLRSLEVITYEAHTVQRIIDAATQLPEQERRGAKQRVAALRAAAQELLEWASDARLELPRN